MRTSPAEAHNALIRMPAEMKRDDGAAVKTQERQQDKHRCPGICSPSNTQGSTRGPTHAPIKQRVSEQAAHELQTEFIHRVSGVRDRAVPILNQIHETHRAECYLSLSEYCIQLICDI